MKTLCYSAVPLGLWYVVPSHECYAGFTYVQIGEALCEFLN